MLPVVLTVAAVATIVIAMLRLASLEQRAIPTIPDVDARVAAAKAERDAILARIAALEPRAAEPEPAPANAFIIVGVQERTLALYEKGKASFRTKAGVGKGETVLDGVAYGFETPLGRYRVTAKEEAPIWIAPDWHYLELAQKLKFETEAISRGRPWKLKDGSWLAVQGDTVARCSGDREAPTCTPYGMGEVIAEDRTVFIPPGDTVQRRYPDVLGTHRLKLGAAYAIHGTDKPGSVGRASSHGCIRLKNADIDVLYEKVDVGTVVLVY